MYRVCRFCVCVEVLRVIRVVIVSREWFRFRVWILGMGVFIVYLLLVLVVWYCRFD